ncbi:Do family serine endopeptidase [Alienimonas californiensis]|uniref:hypothetical protein n=1 Tax=Alienimonas californiensis TaxID=2527989 RepID=UPI0011A2E21B|nr:hypothetical protein [Alienimonas californiensis]
MRGAPDAAADWLTVRVALTAAVVAALMLVWSGWRWWSAPPTESAAVSPTRLGVLFSPYPVPPADGSTADGSTDLADRAGLLVTAVDAYGAVRRSGGRVGDVWLTVAGQPLCDDVDPQAAAERVHLIRRALGPGFAMEVELLRGDELRTIVLRADAPEHDGPPPYAPVWPRDLPYDRGLMGAELIAFASLEPGSLPGVLVGSTVPGGPADQAGVRAGDRLVGLARPDGAASSMAAALSRLLTPLRPVSPESGAPGHGAGQSVADESVADESSADGAATVEPLRATIGDPADWFAVARHIRPGELVSVDLLRRGRPLSLQVRFVAERELPRVRRLAPLGL